MTLTEYPGLRHDVSSFVSWAEQHLTMDYSPHLLPAVLRHALLFLISQNGLWERRL